MFRAGIRKHESGKNMYNEIASGAFYKDLQNY